MRTHRLRILAALASLALALPAQASFHFMQIEQVIGGVNGDPTAQAVQLRMRQAGQNFVGGSNLIVVDAAGNNPITLLTFPSNVTVSDAGSRILITTASFASYESSPIASDFTMIPIPASYFAAGRLTFQNSGQIFWSVSWGGAGYTGANSGTLDNDADGNFGPAFAGALPSTSTSALRFNGAASAMSTNNAADYSVNAASFINNAGNSTSLIANALFLSPQKDNTLYEDAFGQTSNGQGIFLFAGKTTAGNLRRGLIAFDLSAIPTNATVTAATVSMFLSQTHGGPAEVSLSKALKNWGEGASDAGEPGGFGIQAETGDATWLHTFYDTSLWTAPGGDFSATSSATTTVSMIDTTYTWGGSGLVADVQAWVSTPANNFGWVIRGNEVTSGVAERFNTGENSSSPPRLAITYQVSTPTPTPSILGNISTRLRVLTGDNALIGGMIATGTATKRVILRAIGPTLTDFGVPGALADPTLDLFQGNTLLASNDDWRQSSQQAEIQTSGFAPNKDAESAIIWTLIPGQNYTAIVRGVNNTTGVGVVEAFDLDHAAASKLGNISTRGFVDVGDNVMIAGLIVTPNNGANLRILARALGPTLADFGVPNTLADPTLDLVNSSGTVLFSNNNWQDDPLQRSAIIAAGLAPSHDEEAALVQTVAPGAYTVVVRGIGATPTGVALVEAYHLP